MERPDLAQQTMAQARRAFYGMVLIFSLLELLLLIFNTFYGGAALTVDDGAGTSLAWIAVLLIYVSVADIAPPYTKYTYLYLGLSTLFLSLLYLVPVIVYVDTQIRDCHGRSEEELLASSFCVTQGYGCQDQTSAPWTACLLQRYSNTISIGIIVLYCLKLVLLVLIVILVQVWIKINVRNISLKSNDLILQKSLEPTVVPVAIPGNRRGNI